jgi:chromosome segregation ATPase
MFGTEHEDTITMAEYNRISVELEAEKQRHEMHSNLNGTLSKEIEELKAEIKKLHNDWNTQARFNITDSARAERKIRAMQEIVKAALNTVEVEGANRELWDALMNYKKEMATNQG